MLGVKITLTTLNIAYNLYTLAVANNTSISRNAHAVIVQWDSGNGTANVYTGGPNITSSANKGIALNSNVDTLSFDAPFNGFQLDGLYALSDTSGSVLNLNVEVI
jgi:hypothetical protein